MLNQDQVHDSTTLSDSGAIRFRNNMEQLQAKKTTQRFAKQLDRTKSRYWQVYLLATMIAIITAVSVYDVYWSFKTADILHATEQNPIGTWLINLDGGDISLFMTVKMVGTMMVILSIPALFNLNRRYGLVCAGGITIFQCLLMAYFELGHLLFG